MSFISDIRTKHQVRAYSKENEAIFTDYLSRNLNRNDLQDLAGLIDHPEVNQPLMKHMDLLLNQPNFDDKLKYQFTNHIQHLPQSKLRDQVLDQMSLNNQPASKSSLVNKLQTVSSTQSKKPSLQERIQERIQSTYQAINERVQEAENRISNRVVQVRNYGKDKLQTRQDKINQVANHVQQKTTTLKNNVMPAFDMFKDRLHEKINNVRDEYRSRKLTYQNDTNLRDALKRGLDAQALSDGVNSMSMPEIRYPMINNADAILKQKSMTPKLADDFFNASLDYVSKLDQKNPLRQKFQAAFDAYDKSQTENMNKKSVTTPKAEPGALKDDSKLVNNAVDNTTINANRNKIKPGASKDQSKLVDNSSNKVTSNVNKTSVAHEFEHETKIPNKSPLTKLTDLHQQLVTLNSSEYDPKAFNSNDSRLQQKMNEIKYGNKIDRIRRFDTPTPSTSQLQEAAFNDVKDEKILETKQAIHDVAGETVTKYDQSSNNVPQTSEQKSLMSHLHDLENAKYNPETFDKTDIRLQNKIKEIDTSDPINRLRRFNTSTPSINQLQEAAFNDVNDEKILEVKQTLNDLTDLTKTDVKNAELSGFTPNGKAIYTMPQGDTSERTIAEMMASQYPYEYIPDDLPLEPPHETNLPQDVSSTFKHANKGVAANEFHSQDFFEGLENLEPPQENISLSH